MIDKSEGFDVGRRVCVVGIGTAAMVHSHETVKRLTKLWIITVNKAGFESRYRRIDLQLVGAEPYGGRRVSLTCLRPKATS